MPLDPVPTTPRTPRAASEPVLATAGSRSVARLPRGAERRRFRRVETPLGLRFLHAQTESKGRLVDVSAGGARIACAYVPPTGAAVVLYAERLGRLEGVVVRHVTGGFAVRFTHRLGRAKRLADALTWVLNRPPERDRRRARRYPQDEPARLARADGSVAACRILDISTTGASVCVPDHLRPPIGEAIVLGVMRARVVRHHHDGIGVLFDQDAVRPRTDTPAASAPPKASARTPAH